MTDTSPATGPSAEPEFTFITTCKGRLHHLQQTLPLTAGQPNSETIVVDYNCPQKTGDWVEQHYPQVKVVRVTDDEGFLKSRALNLAVQASRTPWLVFIDADILLVGDLLGWLRPRLAPGNFFRPEIEFESMDKFGTFACHRDDFLNAGGYDELLRGWGMEDNDMYYRLRLNGCKQNFYPAGFIKPIPHGDEERTQFSPYRNRWVSHMIASLYVQMKYDLHALLPERDSSEFHEKLYEHAKMNVLRIIRQGANADLRVPLPLGDHPGMPCMNPFWGIERKMVYTLSPRAPFGSQPPPNR
jgi:glycosyltransferase involved in cell wall biosynthesis